MTLGAIKIHEYLTHVKGLVVGNVMTDAKDRRYFQKYSWKEMGDYIEVSRADGYGDSVRIRKIILLDESLIAFFGLYSGDGSKGTEDSSIRNRIIPSISFSQKEKHLVRFAVDQFHKIFGDTIRFTFSLGEDSALFMDESGLKRLNHYYESTGQSNFLSPKRLDEIRPELNDGDTQYLREVRPDVTGTNEEHLAFYYQHKAAMEAILTKEKNIDLREVGIEPEKDNIRVTASLRRPFKKGARTFGGSSRSDEIHIGGLNGFGELFLKIMHEIEESILFDRIVSSTGLIHWNGAPNTGGEVLDIHKFFTESPFGVINNNRPKEMKPDPEFIIGQWKNSSVVKLKKFIRITPLWCYISGLYLAEGSTPKEELFKMFGRKPGALSLGFTSSEGTSIELMLRTLQTLFPKEDCLDGWKVKVGSQYFPELVLTGLKHGMPMLRGGASGDGKLRTMEISLEIKQWALNVADAPLNGVESILSRDYSERYSHVEPTGAGVARIDFWASASICRWYFPILMYIVFGGIINDPREELYQ